VEDRAHDNGSRRRRDEGNTEIGISQKNSNFADNSFMV
jgi:hypothetical protein